MLDGRLGVALKPGVKIGGVVLPGTFEMLRPELEWRQRVFDFVGDLLRHLPPCAFTLQRRPVVHAFLELGKQFVVRCDQAPNFIPPTVLQRCRTPPSCQRIRLHVETQPPQRAHDAVGQRKGQSTDQHEQHRIHGRKALKKGLPIRFFSFPGVVMDVTQCQHLAIGHPKRPNHFRSTPNIGPLCASLIACGRPYHIAAKFQGDCAVR